MRRLYLLCFTLLGGLNAQNIYLENFSGYLNPTLQNLPDWFTQATDTDDPNLNQGNYWGTFNGEFRCNDVEGPGNNNLNYITTRYFSITGAGKVSLSVDFRHTGSMECGCGPNCEDLMTFAYSLDGAPYVAFAQNGVICGSIGSPGQAQQNCLEGDSISVRITIGNQANGEDYFIDNIRIDAQQVTPISAGQDTLICSGTQGQLSGSGGSNYQWSGPGLSCTACANPLAQPSQSTWYTLNAVDAQGCLQDDSVWVEVISTPALNLGADTVVCSGISLLIGTSADTLSQFLWNTGDTLSQLSVTQSGLYYLIQSNICGVSVDSITVSMQQGPMPNLPVDTLLCVLSFPLDLWAGQADSYAWSTGETSDSIQVTQAGWYYVALNSACGTVMDSVQVLSDSLAWVVSGGDTSLCGSSNIQLLATSNASVFLWNNGSTLPQISVNSPGTYWVRVTNLCGTATDTVVVEAGLAPMPIFSDTILSCLGDSLQIALNDGSYGVVWPDQSTGSEFWVADTGLYVVLLQRCNQSLADSFKVALGSSSLSVVLPNVFSPNGDGINDMYQIPILAEDLEFWVFNRWGQCLFQGNQNKPWDGSKAPEGVYQVTARWTDPCLGTPVEGRTTLHVFR